MQFIDLKAQQLKIRPAIDAAMQRVLDHGQYVMGPEIATVETALAEFCGCQFALSCANGTDAIIMALLTKQLQARDAVLVPTYTFAATAEAVLWVGAQPIFVDCLPNTFNLDPQSLEQGIAVARRAGLRPAGIITVDLFGQPVDYATIQKIAKAHDLWIIADGAQSFGAQFADKKVGNIVDLTTTSFFPAKPLGCYGDGGAIFTNDANIVETLKSIRVHGHGTDPTQYVRLGLTGRMDTMQAAILLEKLKIFPAELQARQKLAEFYTAGLKQFVQTPELLTSTTSSWAQYTIVLPARINRQQLMAQLKAADIPTVIYYPHPIHRQPFYQQFLTASGNRCLPIAEDLAARVLSLPMSAYVSEADAARVVQALSEVLMSSRVNA